MPKRTSENGHSEDAPDGESDSAQKGAHRKQPPYGPPGGPPDDDDDGDDVPAGVPTPQKFGFLFIFRVGLITKEMKSKKCFSNSLC